MASTQATAAKRQNALNRIAKALDITFVYVHGDSENRHACYLEQIAEKVDPNREHLQAHVINGAVTKVPQADDEPRQREEPLPALPDGYQVLPFSGGYVLNKTGEESVMGPAHEWRDRARSDDTFDTERQTIEAAIALVTPEEPPKRKRKEVQHA